MSLSTFKLSDRSISTKQIDRQQLISAKRVVESSAQLSLILPNIEGEISHFQSAISTYKKQYTDKKINPFLLSQSRLALFERLLASRSETTPNHVVEVWKILIPTLIEFSHHLLSPTVSFSANLRHVRQIFKSSKRENTFSSSPELFNNNIVDCMAAMLGVIPHSGSSHLIEGLLKGERGSFDKARNAYARNEAVLCMELIMTRLWYKRHREHASDETMFIYTFMIISHLYWECSYPDLFERAEIKDFNVDNLAKDIRQEYHRLHETQHMSLFFRYVTENVTAMRQVRMLSPKRYKNFLFRDERWSIPLETQLEQVMKKYVHNIRQV